MSSASSPDQSSAIPADPKANAPVNQAITGQCGLNPNNAVANYDEKNYRALLHSNRLTAFGIVVVIVFGLVGYNQYYENVRLQKLQDFRKILAEMHDNKGNQIPLGYTIEDTVQMDKGRVQFETLCKLEEDLSGLLTHSDYLALAKYGLQFKGTNTAQVYLKKAKPLIDETNDHIAAITYWSQMYLCTPEKLDFCFDKAVEECHKITDKDIQTLNLSTLYLNWATAYANSKNLKKSDELYDLAISSHKYKNVVSQADWELFVDFSKKNAKLTNGLIVGELNGELPLPKSYKILIDSNGEAKAIPVFDKSPEMMK